MENTMDANFEFIDPNEEHSIKLYVDTTNEVSELRNILHKVSLFAQTEDDVENMLAWTEMGITLACTIKNLQIPVETPLDCSDLLASDDVEEDEEE